MMEKERKKLTLVSAFSGIGAYEYAFEEAGIPIEIIKYCEIDKKTALSYSISHDVSLDKNLVDISLVKKSDFKEGQKVDIFVNSSPCQDITRAGKNKGAEKNSGTRSSLMWEGIRVIELLKPRFVFYENVQDILSPKNFPVFKKYIKALENIGYKTSYKVITSSNHGVFQNRKRVYVVSKLEGEEFIEWPEEEKLIGTILSNIVDENIVDGFLDIEQFLLEKDSYFKKENFSNEIKTIKINNKIVFPYNKKDINTKKIIKKVRKAKRNIKYFTRPFIKYNETKNCFEIREAVKQGYKEAKHGDIVNFDFLNSKLRRGRIGDGVCQTVLTSPQHYIVLQQKEGLSIRKLTTLEIGRIMSFKDEHYYKLKEHNVSDNQMLKEYGNSITVKVLSDIFKNIDFYE